jgi:dCTP deaminase
MGLKPDHWIRKMAREHGMIEPFVESQVRAGVISYGVSSYGYDMRVARQFKIFTNVHSAIVDPKNFDPQSFVDYEGDVCIVPPNSFALARSVEYFRIPRSVLTLCVGKSTYARCFRGDTQVALVDGTNPTLEGMAYRAQQGEMFWGYSVGPFGRIIVTQLEAPRYIGRDALMEIELDNGARIFCTPDHEFITRDGLMRQADDLRPGTALMPLYRQIARGYEMVYQPLNGQMHPTHRLADEWNVRHGVYQDAEGTHRHHIDFDRRNNNPWNLVRMQAAAHVTLHNTINYGEDFDPVAHGASISEALMRRFQDDPTWREAYLQAQSRRAQQFWHSEVYAEQRAEWLEKMRASWTNERREAARQRMASYYADPENLERRGRDSREAWARDDGTRRAKQRELIQQIRTRTDIDEEKLRQALHETGSIRGAARLLACDRTVFKRFPELMAEFRGQRSKYRNHKVTAIRSLPGDHDVYCLTVPEAGNFALSAGVFVHNCGIITNITPFEPGWEGHVTLEISNTTPLPARIYAEEGIAQVLFFEADEECEVSYADKKGKYQGQRGVTPPKI